MDRNTIDEIVAGLMVEHGPDGHIDGHEIITDFIVDLLENKNLKKWKDYRI
jgi:hypothetical protein